MTGDRSRLSFFLISCLCVAVSNLHHPPLSLCQNVNIEEVNGVIVVRNPKNPVPLPGTPSRLLLAQDLVIGEDREKENYWFSLLNSMDVDDSGNIYTLDPKDIKIRVFDNGGMLLRTFGRRGQGPGEFSGPGSIQVRDDRKLQVFDVLNRRLSLLTLDGKSIRDIPAGGHVAIVIKSDSRGRSYFQDLQVKENRQIQEIFVCDASLRPVRTISSYESPWNRDVIGAFSPRFFADAAKDGGLIYGLTSAYEINVVNPDGKTIRRILKDYDPKKITSADKEQFLKRFERPNAPFRFKYEFPEYFPAVEMIIVDDRNQIYARTYQRDSQGRIQHDVFNAEGRYVSRFFLPENERIAVIRNGRLYGVISESDEGIPLVKRYALRWE